MPSNRHVRQYIDARIAALQADISFWENVITSDPLKKAMAEKAMEASRRGLAAYVAAKVELGEDD